MGDLIGPHSAANAAGGKSMRKASAKGGVIETLLGSGTTVIGDVEFGGGLHLEGRVEGNVKGRDSHSRLDISEEGCVSGEVRVATVAVNGTVEGDIHADQRLVLGEKAQIDGNVFYHVLEMAAGAKVNGKLVHRPHTEPLALEHRGSESRSRNIDTCSESSGD